MSTDTTARTSSPSLKRLGALLVATLIVNAIALYFGIKGGDVASGILPGLIFGQMCVAALWVTYGRQSRYRRWGGLLIVILSWTTAIVIVQGISIGDPLGNGLLVFAILSVYVLIVLIVFVLFQFMKSIAKRRMRTPRGIPFRFDFKDIFVAATFVALVAATARSMAGELLPQLLWMLANVASLGVIVGGMAVYVRHKILVTAIALIVALGLAWLMYDPRTPELVPLNLTEAVTILTWLWLGGIIPTRSIDSDAVPT